MWAPRRRGTSCCLFIVSFDLAKRRTIRRFESRYSASNIYTLFRSRRHAAAARASPVGRLSRFFVLGFPCSLELSALGWTASATRLQASYQIAPESLPSLFLCADRIIDAKAHALLTRHSRTPKRVSKRRAAALTRNSDSSERPRDARTRKTTTTPNNANFCTTQAKANVSVRTQNHCTRLVSWTHQQPSSAKK